MPFRETYPFLFAFVLVALPSFAQAEGDEYIFILGARGNPYWATVAEGIKDEAKAKNINAIVYETDNDRDAEGQLNICLTAIQHKPKVLVMQAMTSTIGIECFKQAVKQGIKVADIDIHLTPEEANKAGFDLAFSVGSDNFAIGQEAAQFAAGVVGKPNPRILVLEGAAGSIPSQKRVGGFTSEIEKLLPAAKVTSISADWDRLKAMNITVDTLQSQPDLDLVFTANDVMALGAVEGVRSANKQDQVKVIGVDGIADARKAVADGRMTATVAQLPYLIGMKAAELAASGQQPPNIVETTPTPILTSESLKADTNPLLQYVR